MLKTVDNSPYCVVIFDPVHLTRGLVNLGKNVHCRTIALGFVISLCLMDYVSVLIHTIKSRTSPSLYVILCYPSFVI